MADIAKVPGIETTSPAFRAGLYELADRHNWNVDAIAAVISSESRFNPSAKNPGGTASGLLQWIDQTARDMFGVSAQAIRTMSAEEQLPLIERWFERTLGDGQHRPVDYYLVGWGARPGLPLEYHLAVQGSSLYTQNSTLDLDGSGVITVSDLDRAVARTLGAAGGQRIDASPLAVGLPRLSRGLRVPSCSLLLSQPSVENLALLRKGSRGPDVAFVQWLLGALGHANGLMVDGKFGPVTRDSVIAFQIHEGLHLTDGTIGPETWSALYGKTKTLT
jgi:hypothetical protein